MPLNHVLLSRLAKGMYASETLGRIFTDSIAAGLLPRPCCRPQIIDAGSSGSRMHVYEWEPRMFKTLPPPISIPGSTNQWTQRMEPGISDYSTHPEVSI